MEWLSLRYPYGILRASIGERQDVKMSEDRRGCVRIACHTLAGSILHALGGRMPIKLN